MPNTFVFDVLLDMIAPVRARAGQVLVVPLSPKAQLFDNRDVIPPGLAEMCEWDS